MPTGKQLAQELGIDCKQALYSQWGNFYAPIRRYPCALFDEFGYVVVNSPEDLESCGIKFKKRTNVSNRISSAPTYQRVGAWRTQLTEEISSDGSPSCYEGAVETVTINRYERDRIARSKCIAHYGYTCNACDIDLSKKYGAIAKNFIHVHHIVKLSTIAEEYQVDPVTDLVPLCPNCHAIAHLRREPYSIQEIKNMLETQKS